MVITRKKRRVKTNAPSNKVKSVVDELGYVKAQIADLEAKETELRQSLIDSGFRAAEGEFFRCTVSVVEWERVAYKDIVEDLPPSPQLKRLTTKHTSKEKKVVVKVVSR